MRLNKLYKDFVLNLSHYISVLYGGSGSGKSVAVTQHIILLCLRSKQVVWVFRKRQVDLKDSVISLFLSTLNDENIDYTYKASTMELLIGDSIIKFRGLDDPERIKSAAGITVCWCEECTELLPEDIDQLFLRLRDKDTPPRFIFSFNPVSKVNWVYRYFFDPTSQEYMLENKDAYILKSTWRDNRTNLPQSYIDHLLSLKRTNPVYYDIYSEGEWGVLGKLIFPYGSYQVKKLQVPLGAKYLDGLDLGWNDPNGLACSRYWTEEGRTILYTNNVWSGSECTADTIVSALKKYCNGRVVYGDNAAAAQIAEIQKNGYPNLIPNHKPPGSILANIDTIKSCEWYVDPSCEELLRELTVYSWKKDKKTGLYLDEPERGSGESHVNIIDGLRYSLEGMGKVVTVPKFKLPKGL